MCHYFGCCSITSLIEKTQINTSLLIAANFLCWAPFYSTIFLHQGGLLDMTKTSRTYNIVIIFISSLLNPFIYCDLLRCNTTRFYRFSRNMTDMLRTYIRRMNQVGPSPDLEMNQIRGIVLPTIFEEEEGPDESSE